jgi:tetrahydromethanopterin S-methyltransferase subunit B
MVEMIERMAKAEERMDALTKAIDDVKQAIRDVDTRMESGFSSLRAEMNAQFRWLIGGIASAMLAILLAILGAAMTLK